MALVTYHGPRPEITASFPMCDSDVLTFANGRPSEVKKPGPHSYVLPRDHPVPVGVVFAVGLAVLARTPGLPLTVRLTPGDWALVCERLPGLQRVTPRMLATLRRRRLLRAMLRRRSGHEYAVVERTTWCRWYPPQARGAREGARYRKTWHALNLHDEDRWPVRAVRHLGWNVEPLRASATRNLSVNEEPAWRAG